MNDSGTAIAQFLFGSILLILLIHWFVSVKFALDDIAKSLRDMRDKL